jgi:hypothetical protein
MRLLVEHMTEGAHPRFVNVDLAGVASVILGFDVLVQKSDAVARVAAENSNLRGPHTGVPIQQTDVILDPPDAAPRPVLLGRGAGAASSKHS